jgi:hypothetical protein
MVRRSYKPEQIINKLREAEVLLSLKTFLPQEFHKEIYFTLFLRVAVVVKINPMVAFNIVVKILGGNLILAHCLPVMLKCDRTVLFLLLAQKQVMSK